MNLLKGESDLIRFLAEEFEFNETAQQAKGKILIHVASILCKQRSLLWRFIDD